MTERTATIGGYTFTLNSIEGSDDLSVKMEPPESKEAKKITIKSNKQAKDNLKTIIDTLTDTEVPPSDDNIANATALRNYIKESE